MLIVDGHLDLAMNALLGRDLRLPLPELRASDPVPGETATVSFPELRKGGVRLAFGTLFALPASAGSSGYTDAEGARQQALTQLDVYTRWQDEGHIRLLRSAAEVAAFEADALTGSGDALGVVLLMEGADPIRDADDLPFWVERGVRLIGPAWGRTRYAGGTNAPGPLTPAGRDLVAGMRDLGVTLDASHLDDAAFWDAADLGVRMIASHSNARALLPGNRHLTDDMARAVMGTGGVIGLVCLSTFIRAGWDATQPRVPLTDLAAHARHYAALGSWAHVALGTDLDGGFGQEKTPVGLDSCADLPRFLDLLPAEARAGVAGGNWLRWLKTHL